MDEIVLEYETTKGVDSTSFKPDTDVIKLGRKKVTSLILDPISHCSNLRRLWLNDNQLESIDLSPLSHCTRLEILSISGNNLSSIDLAPLKHCSELKELYLHKNNIESIDLAPLRDTKKLSILFLDRNRLRRVQLDALFECNSLHEIRLWKNLMPSVNVSPLFYLPHFRTLHIEEDKVLTMDLTLRYLAEEIRTNRFIQGVVKHRRIEWLDYSPLSIRSGWPGVRSRLLEILSRTPSQNNAALVRGFFEAFGLAATPEKNVQLKDVILSIPEDIGYSDALNIIEQKIASY